MKKKRTKNKKILIIIAILLAIVFYLFLKQEKRVLSFNKEFPVVLNYDGLIFETKTNSETIENFLKEKNIILEDEDIVLPQKSELVYPKKTIRIIKAKKIKILVDGEEIEVLSNKKNVRQALEKNNITLSKLDKTDPELDFPIQEKLEIVITRINIEKIKEIEEIDFKTIVKKDSDLGWREKKISQKGTPGEKEITYEITYKNGKEISREIIDQKILSEPTNQIETQGTYVKLGKSHKGQASWYAYKGGLYAANPWLPMGSYVKVTNTENSKSVIVQINDRGPFVPGRIIDLDKVAFQKIASIGAGVIGIKMEEILN